MERQPAEPRQEFGEVEQPLSEGGCDAVRSQGLLEEAQVLPYGLLAFEDGGDWVDAGNLQQEAFLFLKRVFNLGATSKAALSRRPGH